MSIIAVYQLLDPTLQTQLFIPFDLLLSWPSQSVLNQEKFHVTVGGS